MNEWGHPLKFGLMLGQTAKMVDAQGPLLCTIIP